MSSLRIGGIASGFDTEQIIRDLMRVERMRVDKTFQKKQVLQWQKEQYRGMTNKIRAFRDTYFDTLRPETNIMRASTLQKMSVTSVDPSIVTATATAGATVGTRDFQVIQSATAATASASATTIDSATGARLSLDDTMEAVSAKLANGTFTFDATDSFTLTINEKQITVNKSDTLRSVLSKINTSDAGVQAAYSTFSDTFTFTAKETGAGFITTDDGGQFFSALGITVAAEGSIGTAGRDAVFTIDGFEGTRSSNAFTIDGVAYSINKKIEVADNSPAISINVSVDTDAIYNTIEKFIKDYNQLIDDISSKLKEEKYRDYPPLTDEQKTAMTEKDIEKWEEKAQSGLLRRDSALENLLRDMRSALYDAVGEEHLTAIGIETSSNYRDNGKLVLRDGGNVLRTALSTNPDQVINLFTRSSDIAYSPNLTEAERTQRYNESGLAHRLSDILQNNIRTTRNSQGHKGVLIERAGIVGDLSEFQNYYDTQIRSVNKRIDTINEMLIKKENNYYRQFTAMEKVLQQLYSQGDWLTSQMQSFNG